VNFLYYVSENKELVTQEIDSPTNNM